MWQLISLCLFSVLQINALWDADTNCPGICTCRLEHLTETAIHRFMRNHKQKPILGEMNSPENNDVFFEDNLETEIFQDKPVVRSAICILQTETNPLALLEALPKDIETLTLIQGYASGNKTIKFSDLNIFQQLLSLELVGPNSFTEETKSHLLCEIDKPLSDLKYLNLERVLIKNSKDQIQNFVKELNEDDLTFEYVQKLDPGLHELTIVQKGTNEEILPYEKYKKQQANSEVPLFFGFKHLLLLRISNCELNSVHWAMFDGLQNLEYLILEKNNLRFIPSFAFYGTPKLKTLSLAHNNLLDIQITDLAGLLELEYLDLAFNNFSQLSELSLPPFPNLKLANFRNNPIGVIFPNTFEVMNTTDSLIIGSDDMPLSLLTNSFLGLNLLKEITINNVKIDVLKRDLLIGMPNLKELIFTGKISSVEYDAFLEVYKLEKLIMSNCQLQNLSMDAFIGLEKLQYLDLSKNQISSLPPGVFDKLLGIKELYLNGNKLKYVARDMFAKIHPKLLRLNENPWHCSCEMSEWKPMIINKIKQKIIKHCDQSLDKGTGCAAENRPMFKYIYDNKIAPKCSSPIQYENWSVFQAMRKLMKCKDYRPKMRHHGRKHNRNSLETTTTERAIPRTNLGINLTDAEMKDKHFAKKLEILNRKIKKQQLLQNLKEKSFGSNKSGNLLNGDNSMSSDNSLNNDNSLNDNSLDYNNDNDLNILQPKTVDNLKYKAYGKKFSGTSF